MLELDSDLEQQIQDEIQRIDSEIDKLTAKPVEAPDPDWRRNAIIEIQAGEGGDESALFCAILYKMYKGFAEKKKWQIEDLDFAPGNAGGFKNLTIMIRGKGAYGALRHESGGHKIQRISPTDSKSRMHTSMATIVVLPEIPVEDVAINKSEVKVETYNSGGKGGQHGNRSMNAVKLTHLPTGITACSQAKSYFHNLKVAWNVLAARISDGIRQAAEQKEAAEKKTLRGKGSRNERIRTYNYPQNRVTDYRLGENYDLSKVVKGALLWIL
jgi:peptide chain release factor 1